MTVFWCLKKRVTLLSAQGADARVRLCLNFTIAFLLVSARAGVIPPQPPRKIPFPSLSGIRWPEEGSRWHSFSG